MSLLLKPLGHCLFIMYFTTKHETSMFKKIIMGRIIQPQRSTCKIIIIKNKVKWLPSFIFRFLHIYLHQAWSYWQNSNLDLFSFKCFRNELHKQNECSLMSYQKYELFFCLLKLFIPMAPKITLHHDPKRIKQNKNKKSLCIHFVFCTFGRGG